MTILQKAIHLVHSPTLSIVVPNYNHARYLEGALVAHLNQSALPLEIIVVDDASTDESRTIVERLAARHPTVRLVSLPVNGGVNAAINRGLAEAKGEYVCFSAADDLVEPEFAAHSLAILAHHPATGFCFSDPAVLSAKSGGARRFPLFLSDRPCLLSPCDFERLLTSNYFSFSSNSILYRREALIEIGGFIEDLCWYADGFANYVLAFRHGACYVPEVLTLYRVSEDSYSACGARQVLVQRNILYRVLDLLEESRFRDVAGYFRRAAIVPEMRGRSLFWLLAHPRHRGHLTLRLCARLLFGELWLHVLPCTPDRLRRAMRWLAGMPTRWQLAASKRNSR